MVTKELLDYIQKQKIAGKTDHEIRTILSHNDWSEDDIAEALSSKHTDVPTPPTPTELPGPVDLLKSTWVLYRARLGTLLGISIIPTAFIMVMVFFGTLATVGGFMYSSFKGVSQPTLIPLLILAGLLIAVIVIGNSIIQLWSVAAMITAIRYSSERIGVGEAFKRSWSRVGSLFWSMALSGFIVFGGIMLFALPGIYFAFIFGFSAYIVVCEEIGGMSALLKSRDYIKGHFWGVLGRYAFISFGYILVSGLISSIVGGTGVTYTPATMHNSTSSNYNFSAAILSFLLPLLVTPFIQIYYFQLYSSLALLKSHVESRASLGRKFGYLCVGFLGVALLIALIIGFVTLFKAGNFLQTFTDYERKQALSDTRMAIESYKVKTGEYPANLDVLREGYLKQDLDPSIKSKLEYTPDSQTDSYNLCVSYELKSQDCLGPGSDLKTN